MTGSDRKLHFIKLISPKYIRAVKVQMLIFCIFRDDNTIFYLNNGVCDIKFTYHVF